MTSLPPVVIFDLDDTLIDFTGMAEACWRSICDESAGQLGVDGAQFHAALMIERVAYWADPELNRIGRLNLNESSRQIVLRVFGALGVGDEALARELAEAYHLRRHELVCLFPEAIETIQALRTRGHRIAMMTNGSTESQRGKIVRFDLAQHFDYIQVEGEVGVGKPDVGAYRHALAQLGVGAGDALMVGDDLLRDVHGPQQAGLRGVWVDRPGTGLPATSPVRPDRIIRSLADLL